MGLAPKKEARFQSVLWRSAKLGARSFAAALSLLVLSETIGVAGHLCIRGSHYLEGFSRSGLEFVETDDERRSGVQDCSVLIEPIDFNFYEIGR